MVEHLPIIGPGALAAFAVSAYYILRVLQGKQRLSGSIACAPFFVSPLIAVLGILAVGYVSVESLNWIVLAWSVALTTFLNVVILYLLWRKSKTHVFKDWPKWRRVSPLRSATTGLAYLLVALFIFSFLGTSFEDLANNECRRKCAALAVFTGNPDYSSMIVWSLCFIVGLFTTCGLASLVDAIALSQRKAQE